MTITATPPPRSPWFIWLWSLALLVLFAGLQPVGASAQTNDAVPTSLLDEGVQQVAAGTSHTCALTTGGAVKCWGDNSLQKLLLGFGMSSSASPVLISNLSSGVAALAAGWTHTCALRTVGTVLCWGNNGSGQLGGGTSSSTLVQVSSLGDGVAALASSAGSRHTCALTTVGTVKCWGMNDFGQLGGGNIGTNSATPVDVQGLGSGTTVALATGWHHTCALTSAGAVACWGDNSYGQLGQDPNATQGSISPVPIGALGSNVVALAAGALHTCALTSAGAVKCWGYNADGELGNPNVSGDSPTPVDVQGLGSGVVALSAGQVNTCALLDNGAVQCWGMSGSATPVDVSGLGSGSGVAALTVGGDHTCVMTTAGAVQCWGDNYKGQLGSPSTPNAGSTSPVRVSGLGSGVATMAGGVSHTCMLGDTVKCWGSNGSGQLGNGNMANSTSPVGVSGLGSGIAALVAGWNHTCVLNSSGQAQCWGDNSHGQLGNTGGANGTRVSVNLSGIATLAAGALHTCALIDTGTVQCWGDNAHGQLGQDPATTASSTSPVSVSGLIIVTMLAAGSNHNCAVTTGVVKCWGDNAHGQLGQDPATTASSSSPMTVPGLGSITALVAGVNHTCALTSGGTVQCWGDNSAGQLGQDPATTASSATPMTVPGLGSVTALVAGVNHTCALSNGGTVQCWGDNTDGQLGNPSTSGHSISPVGVLGLGAGSGITKLMPGSYHTCALTPTGPVQCWGRNDISQLGNGQTTNAGAPVTLKMGSTGQYLSFAPGQPGATINTWSGQPLTLLASSSLPGGTPAISFDVWTPDTCTVTNGVLTTTATPGILCGVRALRAAGNDGAGSSSAAAPAQTRLLLLPQTVAPTAPDAPVDVSAITGSAQANVSWTAPASSSSTYLYTVTSSPGNKVCQSSGPTTCTVMGLTNGTTYTFTVTATSRAGTSPGGTSDPVTLPAVPYPPFIGSVVPGNGQVTLTWMSTGNIPSTTDTVTALPGGQSCSVTGTDISAYTTCTVTGLTNGTSYSFSVTSANDLGSSVSSNSVTATPTDGRPGAPTGLTASAGDRQVTLNWAPTSSGSTLITSYTVTTAPGGQTCTTMGELTCTVSGLTNGTSYSFTVSATNSVGTGSASAPVSATPTDGRPGAPTGLTASAGDSQVTLTWTAPASSGSSAITGYTVVFVPSGVTTACTTTGATSCTVSSLTNGTAYSFTVSASNSAGTGANSDAASATPTAGAGLKTFTGTTVPSGGTPAGQATATITSGGGTACGFDTSATAFVAAPDELPPGVISTHGQFQFQLTKCDATPVAISIQWPATPIVEFHKYGKATRSASSNSYYSATSAAINGADNTITSYTVQDGALGDDDWAVNGTIVDPVLPITGKAGGTGNATPVPTLGHMALVLLALLLPGGVAFTRRTYQHESGT